MRFMVIKLIIIYYIFFYSIAFSKDLLLWELSEHLHVLDCGVAEWPAHAQFYYLYLSYFFIITKA